MSADYADFDDDETSAEFDGEAGRYRRRKGRRAKVEEAPKEEPPVEVDDLGISPIPDPEAFEPASLPRGTFVDEPWDKFLPGPGFFRDLTYALKGSESNTGFSIWSAAWAVASVLARDAWIKWHPKPLWPNLYVLLLAPPGICKKSYSALFADSIVREVPNYFRARGDHVLAFKKDVPILDEKATTEGLSIALKNAEKAFLVKRPGIARLLTVKNPAQLAVCADEFTTLVGQAKYNVGLVDKITTMYDCKEHFTVLTQGRGREEFENVYCNLIGATTPDSFRMSLPDAAYGGGFMSRLIVVYSEVSARIFPEPIYIEGTPTPEELVERLAWIAENCSGEYTFSPEAKAFFNDWYIRWKTDLINGGLDENKMTDLRLDINMRKMAMLIRCQRYKRGNVIELEDIKAAKRIIEYTFAFSGKGLEESGPDHLRFTKKVKSILQRHRSRERSKILRALSGKGCNSVMLDQILWQLQQEMLIKIELDGVEQSRLSTAGREVYTWLGETAQEEEEIDND